MKILMPQEIEVWYVIPAIRRELARAMVRKGLTQKKISERLGVTEAAISNYMKSKRASGVEFTDELMTEIACSAESIVSGSCVVKETQRLCDICKSSMTLCRIHKRYGAPGENCRVCLK